MKYWRRTQPLLITLDDGGYSVQTWRRKGVPKNRKYGSIAVHCGVGHILGEPDIRILKPPKGYGPLVHGHNIFKVLEHEGLHHVMADILDDGHGYGGNNDTLDLLLDWLPTGHIIRRRLLPGP